MNDIWILFLDFGALMPESELIMEDLNKSEKTSVNIGVTELAQIDMLVDNLLYTNRSDFVRIAVKKQLELHKDDLTQIYSQNSNSSADSEHIELGGMGIIRINRGYLEKLRAEHKKGVITVVGLLMIDKKISCELLEQTITSAKVYGKIQSTEEIRLLLERLES